MRYKIEKKRKRYALYIWRNDNWELHQTYATQRGAEVAVQIMYDRGEIEEK